MRLAIAILLLTLLAACKAGGGAVMSQPFSEDFNRTELGPSWNFQGGSWRIDNGVLRTDGDHNVPLWLKVDMPRDVEISFEARSASPAVDIKCELFGDGQTHESGYIIINGGWNNTKSLIGRLQEHELDRVPIGSVPYLRRAGLQPNHTYKWRIVRKGNVITQYLDGEKYLERDDPDGLYGPQNDRFAFNNWNALITFDNLKISPL